MRLPEIYSEKNTKKIGFFDKKIPVISFEVYPPKNDENGEKLEKLISHLEILKKYNPAFVSLTYGAGGTNQSYGIEIIKRIQAIGLSVMPHFTCVCSKKEKIRQYLNDIQEFGIENILALRGDIPQGVEVKDFDFHYANELVSFIKSETNLSVSVAGYPEVHIECDNSELDLINLKRKVETGADAIYTQMFFDNDKFFSFVENVRNMGITIPVIPGILPVTNYNQLDRMLSMARVSLPKILQNKIDKYKDDPDDFRKMGIDFATYQCKQLIDADVEGLHFYTLNSSNIVSQILDNLSIL